MDWVRAPLLLLRDEGTRLYAMNGAARSLFASLALPPLPCPLGDLLGETAALALAGRLRDGDTAEGLAVEMPSFARPVTLLPSRAGPEHWLVTLEQGPVADWHKDLEDILNALPVGVSIFDVDDKAVFENQESSALFGYPQDAFRDLEDWWPVGYPDPAYRALARQAWYDAAAAARASREPVLMNDWAVTCQDGSQKMIQFRFSAIGANNVCVYWDMTEQRRMEAELRELADTDTLTGLLNRRRFFQMAEQAAQASERDGTSLSLLMLDLDHFKQINDRHGHTIGDTMLRAVADRCRGLLRDSDLLARLGGEEFAVLLPDTSREQAIAVAHRLRHSVAAEPFPAGPATLDLRLSVGGATGEPGHNPIDRLLDRADRSLYAAKRAGRNCVRFEA